MLPVILLDYKYNTMTNVQTITLAISIALISGIATFAWNNKTLSEQVEEHNIEVLEECLTKARSKTTSDEILRATKDCNENILTKISKPKSMENITWTASTTPVSSVPLWFQLIPQASANSNVKNAETYGDQKSNDIFRENQSLVTNTVKTADGWNSGSSSYLMSRWSKNCRIKMEKIKTYNLLIWLIKKYYHC